MTTSLFDIFVERLIDPCEVRATDVPTGALKDPTSPEAPPLNKSPADCSGTPRTVTLDSLRPRRVVNLT